jgi:hypothetical protein
MDAGPRTRVRKSTLAYTYQYLQNLEIFMTLFTLGSHRENI